MSFVRERQKLDMLWKFRALNAVIWNILLRLCVYFCSCSFCLFQSLISLQLRNSSVVLWWMFTLWNVVYLTYYLCVVLVIYTDCLNLRKITQWIFFFHLFIYLQLIAGSPRKSNAIAILNLCFNKERHMSEHSSQNQHKCETAFVLINGLDNTEYFWNVTWSPKMVGCCTFKHFGGNIGIPKQLKNLQNT